MITKLSFLTNDYKEGPGGELPKDCACFVCEKARRNGFISMQVVELPHPKFANRVPPEILLKVERG